MTRQYGYIRVSSADQNEVRQRVAMRKQSIAKERIYTDKASGKDFLRPQYQAMLKRLRPGDQLCITSIDRLACQCFCVFLTESANKFVKCP